MTLSELKTQIYNILTVDLGYNVTDNPYKQEPKSFPCVFLTLSSTNRDLRKKVYWFKHIFKIDIFSDYDGEKEILEMEEAIYEKMQKLYDNEYVTHMRESGFHIQDDKSTGVLRKHGVIRYTIYSGGGIADNE